MLLPRDVTTLHWQRNFFSMSSWSNKAPFCYICVPTKRVHILNFVKWIMEVEVQGINFLKSGGWLHKLFTKQTTGDHLFIRLWTHHVQRVWNSNSANPGLPVTLIDTYRLSSYSSWAIFRITFQFPHCCPTVYN